MKNSYNGSRENDLVALDFSSSSESSQHTTTMSSRRPVLDYTGNDSAVRRWGRPSHTFPPRTFRRLEQIFSGRANRMRKQLQENQRSKSQYKRPDQILLGNDASENQVVLTTYTVPVTKSKVTEKKVLGIKVIKKPTTSSK